MGLWELTTHIWSLVGKGLMYADLVCFTEFIHGSKNWDDVILPQLGVDVTDRGVVLYVEKLFW